MHKTAVPPRIQPVSSPDPSVSSAPDVQLPSGDVNRREFIKRTGLALAGATALSTFVGPRRVWAAGPVELTFASANFYGKQTITEVVNALNVSRSNIRVTHKQLPPRSGLVDVEETPVPQLAPREPCTTSLS